MKNKKVLYILVVLITLIFSSISLAAIPAEVTVGKETILTLKKPSSRISIAKPDIADIKGVCGDTKKGVYKCKQIKEKADFAEIISIKEITLNGKQLGTTSLIVWDKEGKPTFFDVYVIPNISEIEAHIKDMPLADDITVKYANDYIVLSGTALNEETIKKVDALARAYAKEGIPIETTRYSAGVTETIKTPAVRVINFIRLKEAQQVILEVKVAQIDKGALKKLGISALIKGTSAEGFFNLAGAPTSTGTTGVAGGLGAAGGATGIVGDAPGLGSYDPLDAFQLGVSYFPSGVGTVLQVLSSKNLAKILAEPNLLVRSGQKGQFLAGSKIPIPVVTSTAGVSTVTIEYKDVGVKLNFEPVVTETGMISLKIDPAEISNITGMIKVAGLESPMIDSREVRTSVELKEGESLILAGLLQEEMIKSMQKIPILGDIPILGALFRSTTDELKEKELAFFITPRLVKPIAPGVKTELPGDNRPTPDEEREFQWIPLPKERTQEGESVTEGKIEPAAKPAESKGE